MTTDTRPKHCAVRFETPAGIVTVGGVAKGAGMIHPDMATLPRVLTTDAIGEPAGLQPLLRRVADRSFNAISVDGDTSTNDTVLLLAGARPASIRRTMARSGRRLRMPCCRWRAPRTRHRVGWRRRVQGRRNSGGRWE